MTPTRRIFLRSASAAALALGAPMPTGTASVPTPLRIAVLKFGTVNWELETIRRLGLDRENGFDLVTRDVASSAAAKISFEGGQADMLVADWIWVARQRAAGRDFVFAPYSRTVGGMIVAEESPIRQLSDLSGRSIGIGGGPLDKSWLILQAHAEQQGFDLANETRPVFGAPPLIMQKGLSGELDAVLNYWHFEARMRAKGFRTLVSVEDAAASLGLAPEIPLLGYVFRESLAKAHPGLPAAFLAASRAAKAELTTSDAAWEALRPEMKAADEAEFIALQAGFRAGIPSGAPVDEASAARLFELLAARGGRSLVGDATTLPAGVFHGAD